MSDQKLNKYDGDAWKIARIAYPVAKTVPTHKKVLQARQAKLSLVCFSAFGIIKRKDYLPNYSR